MLEIKINQDKHEANIKVFGDRVILVQEMISAINSMSVICRTEISELANLFNSVLYRIAMGEDIENVSIQLFKETCDKSEEESDTPEELKIALQRLKKYVEEGKIK